MAVQNPNIVSVFSHKFLTYKNVEPVKCFIFLFEKMTWGSVNYQYCCQLSFFLSINGLIIAARVYSMVICFSVFLWSISVLEKLWYTLPQQFLMLVHLLNCLSLQLTLLQRMSSQVRLGVRCWWIWATLKWDITSTSALSLGRNASTKQYHVLS